MFDRLIRPACFRYTTSPPFPREDLHLQSPRSKRGMLLLHHGGPENKKPMLDFFEHGILSCGRRKGSLHEEGSHAQASGRIIGAARDWRGRYKADAPLRRRE